MAAFLLVVRFDLGFIASISLAELLSFAAELSSSDVTARSSSDVTARSSSDVTALSSSDVTTRSA